MVYLFIPICHVNGFLNRDFMKCASLSARLCHQLFTACGPDLMGGIL